ncbi:MAG: alpha/beta hydrolase [Nitrospirota bacterium]|nr:alpha/beta hydrolase [Nitrospirota bacterium]
MFETFLVFQPSPWEDRNWAQLSGLPLEEVWLPVDEVVTIFGWFVESGPTSPVLLWCHGNAGNVSHRVENMRQLYQRGFSLFIFDYRGYGRSTGVPSEVGLYQDALAAYDYLIHQRRIASERLILFGRSLGATVAGEVAVKRPVPGLIVEGAFPSIQAMSDEHFWGVPARWLMDMEFNLAEKVDALHVPLLVIHGERDSIVPMALGRQVFDAAHKPKQWYVVSGAEHNDVPFVGGEPYFREIDTFIQRVLSKQ